MEKEEHKYYEGWKAATRKPHERGTAMTPRSRQPHIFLKVRPRYVQKNTTEEEKEKKELHLGHTGLIEHVGPLKDKAITAHIEEPLLSQNNMET